MTVILPHEWAKTHARSDPDAPAIVSGRSTVTYGELDRRADAHAGRLADAGVGVGDLVAIEATSSPETIIALVGIRRAGAVALPRSARGFHDRAPAPRGAHTVVPTSGSTGASRGVILTDLNVAASVDASQRRLGNDAADRWLLTLPLFHVGGLSIVWRSLTSGGSVEILSRFDAAVVSRALSSGSVTMASLVPTMLHRMLEHDPGPYPPSKAVLLGGAPASPALVERGLSVGLPILSTYGMSEAASQVATVDPGTATESLGTVGRPLDGVSIAIADDAEILIDGPTVSPGYLGESPRVGPLHTGDLGYIDDRGHLIVSGRRDGMIITGGENVMPANVEAIIDALPGVGGSIVVGVPDDEWGQIVTAIVEAAPEALAAIDAGTRDRAPRHEVPRRWVPVDSIPLLSNGKPDRSAALQLGIEAG